VADQWTIKVPTSLVYLQSDATLPDFELGGKVFDWEKKLDDAAAKLGYKVDWRRSIVDLLKVLGRPSGLTYRRRLAKVIGAPDAVANTGDTVVLNVWLRKAVLKLLGEGKTLPAV
ncbi:MAG: hypothetical protein JWL93_2427, partial [Hyphomicrobiales bacterium]|nr:hypothetical protein [Hyphomicrobiales bacterium]